MTHAYLPLWADAVRTTFEWGRIQSNADWIAPVAVCIAILLFVRWLYRRDAEELRPAWRLAADGAADGGLPGVVGPLLAAALAFGARGGAELPRVAAGRHESEHGADRRRTPPSRQPAQQVAAGAEGIRFPRPASQDARRGRVRVRRGLETGRRCDARQAHAGRFNCRRRLQSPIEWPACWRSATGVASYNRARLGETAGAHRDGNAARPGPAAVDPGRAGTPVSGIIVFSDGGQNAGISPEAAVELAREAKIPVFTVGLGSDRQPTNVAVSDLVVPARAYPGDHYTVTGYLQAQGMAGKTVTVQVCRGPPRRRIAPHAPREEPSVTRSVTSTMAGDLLDSRQVTLGGDGEVLPVKFELTPDAPGRRTLTLRVLPPEGDRNPADNSREADIEIVDRKNHVLLLADGPMREYQFLRNQLFRDRYTTVDVLLQSGKPGMSQEASKTLDDFPRHPRGDVRLRLRRGASTPIGRPSAPPRWNCWRSGWESRAAV